MTRNIHRMDTFGFRCIFGLCRLGNKVNFQSITRQRSAKLQTDIISLGYTKKGMRLYLYSTFHAPIWSKIKGSYFSARPDDKVRRKLINELDILVCILLVCIVFFISPIVTSLDRLPLLLLFLFFHPFHPPVLLFVDFLLRAYAKNFDRTIVRLNCKIGLRRVKRYLGYTMPRGKRKRGDKDDDFCNLQSEERAKLWMLFTQISNTYLSRFRFLKTCSQGSIINPPCFQLSFCTASKY